MLIGMALKNMGIFFAALMSRPTVGFEPSKNLSARSSLIFLQKYSGRHSLVTARNKVMKKIVGGKRGIRTPGTVTRSPHFECGPFDHSGIFPGGVIGCKINVSRQTMQDFQRFFHYRRTSAALFFRLSRGVKRSRRPVKSRCSCMPMPCVVSEDFEK